MLHTVRSKTEFRPTDNEVEIGGNNGDNIEGISFRNASEFSLSRLMGVANEWRRISHIFGIMCSAHK